jgi:hypothetical protein
MAYVRGMVLATRVRTCVIRAPARPRPFTVVRVEGVWGNPAFAFVEERNDCIQVQTNRQRHIV